MKLLLSGILLVVLAVPVFAEDYTIRDKYYNTTGYVKDGKIYDKNYKVDGYIKDGKIYDKYYNQKGYIDRNNRGYGNHNSRRHK